jgi:hypothetical protein
MARKGVISSDELPWNDKKGLHALVGRKVSTYFGPGKIVVLKDGGVAMAVKMPCYYSLTKGCKYKATVYLRRGCAGPDHYAYDSKGHWQADLRDQVIVCPKHKGRKP